MRWWWRKIEDMKHKSKNKITLLPFVSNTGHVVKIPDDWTIHDLAVLGIKLKLQPAEEPLADNWYSHPPRL
jgi:hypothetical protein